MRRLIRPRPVHRHRTRESVPQVLALPAIRAGFARVPVPGAGVERLAQASGSLEREQADDADVVRTTNVDGVDALEQRPDRSPPRHDLKRELELRGDGVTAGDAHGKKPDVTRLVGAARRRGQSARERRADRHLVEQLSPLLELPSDRAQYAESASSIPGVMGIGDDAQFHVGARVVGNRSVRTPLSSNARARRSERHHLIGRSNEVKARRTTARGSPLRASGPTLLVANCSNVRSKRCLPSR